MSNKKNYNKISTEAKMAIDVENVDVAVESIEEPIVEVKKLIGVVANCEKLNVRNRPNVKGNVVCIIDKGTEVEIDEAGSTNEFYKVASVNFKGFCMKKYITVKP